MDSSRINSGSPGGNPILLSDSGPHLEPQDVLVLAAGGLAPGQMEYAQALGAASSSHDPFRFRVLVGGAASLNTPRPRFLSLTPDLKTIDTSRPGNAPDTLQNIHHRLLEMGARRLVMIGGDGTLTLARYLEERGLQVLGIPKSMDGNLAFEEEGGKAVRLDSLGFTSSVWHATEVARTLDMQAGLTHSLAVLEVNGRNTGWLPMMAGWHSGASFFVGEHRATLDNLFDAVHAMTRGGLILVGESAEFFQDEKPVDLQSRLHSPLSATSASLIESCLTGMGVSARRMDLSNLIDYQTASHTVVDQIWGLLKLLSESARVQSRINVVTLPSTLFAEWAKDKLPWGLKSWPRKLADPEVFLQEVADEVRSGKTRVLLIPERMDIKLDEQYHMHDACGRTRFQNREMARTVAALITQETGRKTSATTLTHLLMAQTARGVDKAYAAHLAGRTVQALREGKHGVVLAQTYDRRLPVAVPFARLKDFPVPATQLKPWQGWRFGEGR